VTYQFKPWEIPTGGPVRPGSVTVLAEAMSDSDDMTAGDETVMIDLAMEREMYLADMLAGRA